MDDREAEKEADVSRDGDQRGGDRRKKDRRGGDRRTPPPMWRRPWALVGYGVLGALVVVLLVNLLGDDPEPPLTAEVVSTQRNLPVGTAETPNRATAAAPPVEAGSIAAYEGLIAEGRTAQGRLVRVVLYCTGINSVALRDVARVEAAVAELAGTEARVPAAECRWGQGSEVRRDEFLLLVPPRLAEELATAPVVQDGFVSRRRVDAVVEWIGRSEALALRTTGVLREIEG